MTKTKSVVALVVAVLLSGCSEETQAPLAPTPVDGSSAGARAANDDTRRSSYAGTTSPAGHEGALDAGDAELPENPTVTSTGLDQANLPAGISPSAALRVLTTTLDSFRMSAARRVRPTKPILTRPVEVSPSGVTAEWTASTPPADDLITGYELRFQALAGTGSNATFTWRSEILSAAVAVDAGWYWVFIRAEARDSGYSSSDFDLIEVPEDSEPVRNPPKPPRVTVGPGTDGWICDAGEYCYLAVNGTIRRANGLDSTRFEWTIRPGSQNNTGTVNHQYFENWRLPFEATLRLRGAQGADGVWSPWSKYASYSATAEDAAACKPNCGNNNAGPRPSVPGALSGPFVTPESGGYRVSFTRGSHGGLPITHYEWRPIDAGTDCNGPGLSYQNLQALNDNLEQSFLVYGYGEQLAIRARNAKGTGPCASSPFPGRPPGLLELNPSWTCRGNEYCFKTVFVTMQHTPTYQIEIEERTHPSSTSNKWTRKILERGNTGVQRFIQIDDWWWIHARQRADRNSPWSDWSETLEIKAPLDEAKAHAVPPAGVNNLRATRIGGQTRVQFTRGWHGGLPITAYLWFFHDACSGEPLGEWIPANDNFEQSFILNQTGSAFSIKAKNAKGEGACIGVRVAP